MQTQEVASFAWGLCGRGHDSLWVYCKPWKPSKLWGRTRKWKQLKQLGQTLKRKLSFCDHSPDYVCPCVCVSAVGMRDWHSSHPAPVLKRMSCYDVVWYMFVLLPKVGQT